MELGPALLAGASRLAEVLGSRPVGDLRARPVDGVWSGLEYGCHVRDVLAVQRERIALALAVDRPSFAPMRREERVAEEHYNEQEPSVVARELRAAAEALAGQLAGLDDGQWQRVGEYHWPTTAWRDVEWIARHTLHEERHHLVDVQRLLAALDRRAVVATWSLRPAGSSDAAAVADVFLAARAEMTYLPDLHTEEDTRRYLAEIVLPTCTVAVAQRDGSVEGFAALTDDVLHHLYVHPRSQGRGAGLRLLRWAKRVASAGFTLWVFQENHRALDFYRRRGLVEVRRTDGRGNEEGLPDVLMDCRPDRPGDPDALGWAGDTLAFAPAAPDRPPASDLLAATTAELDELYAGAVEGRTGPDLHLSQLVVPDGLYLVARRDGLPVAGTGLRRLGNDVAEIKRMYVLPGERHRGLGGRLLGALEEAAVDLGYRRLRLDTGPRQPHAIALYERAGYGAIEDYNGSQLASFWGEKVLPTS